MAQPTSGVVLQPHICPDKQVHRSQNEWAVQLGSSRLLVRTPSLRLFHPPPHCFSSLFCVRTLPLTLLQWLHVVCDVMDRYESTSTLVPKSYGAPLGGAFGFLTEGGPGAAPLVPRSWAATVPTSVYDTWPPTTTTQPFWDAHCGNPRGLFGTLDHFTAALRSRYFGSNTVDTVEQFLLASQVAA